MGFTKQSCTFSVTAWPGSLQLAHDKWVATCKHDLLASSACKPCLVCGIQTYSLALMQLYKLTAAPAAPKSIYVHAQTNEVVSTAQ